MIDSVMVIFALLLGACGGAVLMALAVIITTHTAAVPRGGETCIPRDRVRCIARK
jgi:hypothetical protein